MHKSKQNYFSSRERDWFLRLTNSFYFKINVLTGEEKAPSASLLLKEERELFLVPISPVMFFKQVLGVMLLRSPQLNLSGAKWYLLA